jgi:hypothetical protein
MAALAGSGCGQRKTQKTTLAAAAAQTHRVKARATAVEEGLSPEKRNIRRL